MEYRAFTSADAVVGGVDLTFLCTNFPEGTVCFLADALRQAPHTLIFAQPHGSWTVEYRTLTGTRQEEWGFRAWAGTCSYDYCRRCNMREIPIEEGLRSVGIEHGSRWLRVGIGL